MIRPKHLILPLLLSVALVFLMNACTGGPTSGTGSPFEPPPVSPVPTNTPGPALPTKTHTPVPTATNQATSTITLTPTVTLTRTVTSTPTKTATPSRTPTVTATPTGCVVTGGNFSVVGVAAGSSNSNDTGTYVVGPFGLSNSSAVTQLTFAAPSLSGQAMYAGIYADNGSNYPSSVVYQSPLTTITSSGGSAIPVANLSAAPLTLCPGLYWLAIASSSPTNSIVFTGQTSQTTYCDFTEVMPNPFPTSASTAVSVAMQMFFQY